MRFRTNADWKVEIDNPSMFNFGVYPQFGTANTTTGIEYKFRLNDNDLYEGQTAKITFKSQVNGKCNDVVVNIVATREYPNTYIVTPGTSFSFPVKKAYKAWEEDWELKKTTLPAGVLGTTLVWQDAQNLIKASPGVTISDTGRNAIINVQTTAGIEGNAVVALTIGGVIYWSWQLWVTNYNPEVALEHVFSPTTSENIDVPGGKAYSYFNTKYTTVFMDRNLGATSYELGLASSIASMYFWGRKEPYPSARDYVGSTGTYIPLKPVYNINNAVVDLSNLANTGISSTLVLAIRNPKIAYIGAAVGNDGDWYSGVGGTHRDDLWSTAEGKKTVFDPCPKGWRVPKVDSGTKNPMYGLPVRSTPNGILGGLDYSDLNLGVLPATGRMRLPLTGSVASVSETNIIHLASHIPAGSYSVYIQGSDAPISEGITRQMSIPIRCVRDESANR